jgi:hypothetical protein
MQQEKTARKKTNPSAYEAPLVSSKIPQPQQKSSSLKSVHSGFDLWRIN